MGLFDGLFGAQFDAKNNTVSDKKMANLKRKASKTEWFSDREIKPSQGDIRTHDHRNHPHQQQRRLPRRSLAPRARTGWAPRARRGARTSTGMPTMWRTGGTSACTRQWN
jgi:hypothetical protein